MEQVTVIGDRLTIHRPWNGDGTASAPEAFHRQGLAFGDVLYRDVSSLRVGIVGCGATGSATAMLLARLGAQRLILFDPDRVEHTNLSRLQGATHQDADRQRLKVDVVGDMVEGFGLGARAVRITEWVGHPSARDALKSCDIIFGCTDDHDGRTLLNRLAFIYAIPVIDMGIRIDPRDPGQPVREAAGRVTVLQPGARCLMCRRVINGRRAASEHLERTNPGEYERQAREGYVVGVAGPNPAVVHLTTDVAAMAVDELVHRLSGYRAAGSCDHRVRQFHMMADRQPGTAETGECRICEDPRDWSKGDSLQPFLGRIG
ncbi:ThiF family adenylyltransferase [Muricoccus vinaceus]|uniref:ThiF family adenylyltransferase n=1 Tax=Muricoccus vinaceus TaxID=424704 RepID=A0ABV6IRW3_9PROT